jgi:NAD(P)-dependent dehydrogenase (short-subunit alcohol dehydrogenase family)
MGRLQGKVGIITGAARGQGRAAVLRFVEEGAQVAITDLDADGLAETARLAEDVGGSVVSEVGDVTDPECIDALTTKAVQEFGAVHILHNNAGAMLGAALEAYTVQDFDRLMHVNCLSQLIAIQRVAPEMKKAGTGSIINVSSIGGIAAFANMSVYCASKAAVLGLSRAVAYELAPDIRVNAICPGAVDTPMARKLLEAFDDKEAAWESFTARQLQRRHADPREIADVVVFLASDESSFITGATLPVEAGWMSW